MIGTWPMDRKGLSEMTLDEALEIVDGHDAFQIQTYNGIFTWSNPTEFRQLLEIIEFQRDLEDDPSIIERLSLITLSECGILRIEKRRIK